MPTALHLLVTLALSLLLSSTALAQSSAPAESTTPDSPPTTGAEGTEVGAAAGAKTGEPGPGSSAGAPGETPEKARSDKPRRQAAIAGASSATDRAAQARTINDTIKENQTTKTDEAPSKGKPGAGDSGRAPDTRTVTRKPVRDDSLAVELGLNLRTDLGVHPLRLDLALRGKRWEVLAVLDAMFFTDDQSSLDLIGFWRFPLGIHPFAGYRLNTLGVGDGNQFHQVFLAGMAMDLPTFFGGWLRGQWGLELATTLAKHGGGLPPEVLSFASARSYLDLLNFAMYARFDFHLGLF